ncbi:hypothetical protein RBU61_05445 [Tissierella sp. MB52-C2]|uniref:hypothetical protein n=1 Tax=Tissierella sp. MB52-C2 TaxID=3070999 RepID=UPI00280C0E99|nr:hypothetical protein [Tissierella sp. MB52-C2]WMM26119.1 hypothetical protein RBU61_05445 [Tissierella sp. MB52-C2]
MSKKKERQDNNMVKKKILYLSTEICTNRKNTQMVVDFLKDKKFAGDAYQYYLFNQTDIRPHWREIRIFYHQTLLSKLEGISLDGGRYFTSI